MQKVKYQKRTESIYTTSHRALMSYSGQRLCFSIKSGCAPELFLFFCTRQSFLDTSINKGKILDAIVPAFTEAPKCQTRKTFSWFVNLLEGYPDRRATVLAPLFRHAQEWQAIILF